MPLIKKITNFIIEELVADDLEDLPHDYDIVATGLIDSLSLVRLVSWVEGEFDISTASIDLAPADFATVEKIGHFIKLHSSSAT